MDNEQLLFRIATYCARNCISESTFGQRAVHNSKIVGRLRQGGSLTLKTLRRIEVFMMSPTKPGRQPATVDVAA